MPYGSMSDVHPQVREMLSGMDPEKALKLATAWGKLYDNLIGGGASEEVAAATATAHLKKLIQKSK